MRRGFVTIATGDERYYRMARNLLRSYKQTCSKPMPFAVIADERNSFTEEFDDVVLLEHPSRSWMDKMELLNACPYEENIFIDADCLVYQDINCFWSVFENADDFSCFGKVLPLDDKTGWFTGDVAKIYPIHFITHLHGMLYFIRPGAVTEKMSKLCREIIQNYYNVPFTGFKNKLADEPVYALAMAIMNLKPQEREPIYYCFVPFSTKLDTDYYRKTVHFRNPKDGDVNGCFVVHWGNTNTLKYQYRADAAILNDIADNGMDEDLRRIVLYRMGVLRHWYRLQDVAKQVQCFARWLTERISAKMKGIWD